MLLKVVYQTDKNEYRLLKVKLPLSDRKGEFVELILRVFARHPILAFPLPHPIGSSKFWQ